MPGNHSQRRLLFGLLVLICSAVPLRSQQSRTLLAENGSTAGWRKYQAGEVELYSNAAPDRAHWLAAYCASRMDLFAATALFPIMDDRVDGQASQPVRVMHFRDLATFLPFRIAADAPAFHIGGGGRSLVLLQDPGDYLPEIVNHEFFHVYAERAGARLPVWLAEGVGDYFATMQQDSSTDGTAVVRVGEPLARHERALRMAGSQPVDVARLFAVTSENRHRGGEDPARDFYAQSWLLTHLLQSVSPWRESFQDFVAAIPEHGSVGALTQVYGVSPSALSQAAAAYLARGEYAVRLFAMPKGAGAPPAVRELPMAAWEARLLMADVLAFRGQRGAARRSYEGLRDEFPDVPEIRESLANLALDEMRMDEAAGHFAAAAALGSRSGEVYFRLATLECGMQSEDPRCREWLGRALSLSPTKRELRHYAVDFALNSLHFRDAVAWIDSFANAEPHRRFDLLSKRAYASYKMGDIAKAREWLMHAREIASTPSHRKTLVELERAVNEKEAFDLQMELFRDASEGETGARLAALTRLLESFARDPGAVIESARLLEIRCARGEVTLLVEGPGGRRKLNIENTMDLMVLEGTQRRRELELTCGDANGVPVRVGYLTDLSGETLDGRLRILQFHPLAGAQTP